MTYSELASTFNFTLPEYAKELFDGFLETYDEQTTALDENDALLVADAASLPEDGKNALLECVKTINADSQARLCAEFLIYITVRARLPWQNGIYADDLFTAPGLMPEQVSWVIVAAALANTLINKKPPEDLNEENLNAFRGYSRSCHEKKGYWGILEWNWNMLCAGGCMFLFGILKFVPGEFGSDFKVITDGREYISLACGEHFISPDGELTDDETDCAAKTSFYEDGEKYVANAIDRTGKVNTKTEVFMKNVWKDFLTKGTPTLDIHIPANVSYTPENIKSACETALGFYKKHFPELVPAAIAGYSWIFAPQLEKVLPESSNILRVNRSCHIIPTKGTYDEECRFIRKNSSLQTKIAEECKKGTRFHYSVMFIPTGELNAFGKE